jgi:hypothetical protein
MSGQEVYVIVVFGILLISHALYIDALRRRLSVLEDREENTWKTVQRLAGARKGWEK